MKQSDFHFKHGDDRKPELLCSVEGCKAYRLLDSLGSYCLFHSRSFGEKKELDIVTAMNSEDWFKPLFPDESTWLSWRVVLKSIFCLPMNEEEEKIFFVCLQVVSD